MLFNGVSTKGIRLFKMQIKKQYNLTASEVRNLLDHLILFKHNACLSSVKLSIIMHGIPLYDVEYTEKTVELENVGV